MSATRHRQRVAALCALATALLAGCAGNSAPRGWLPEAADAQAQANGGWVTVNYQIALDRPGQVDGELIAIGPDSLYVLDTVTLHAVHLGSVSRARMTA